MENFMNHLRLISVVIPTYNRTKPTMEAIESVLAQTYENLEIIVIDDGSTDGSSDAIREFVEHKAACEGQTRKVQYFCQANQGSSSARNSGIRHAQGDYIAFLDSDDVWLPEKLEVQLLALEEFRGKASACFTDARCVSKTGLEANTFESFKKGYDQRTGIDHGAMEALASSFCGFWISTLMVEASVIREIGGFQPGLHFVEDRDCYFRLSLVTPLVYVNQILACVDRSMSPPGSQARPWDDLGVRLRGLQRMYRNWLGLQNLPKEARKSIVRGLQATHSEWTNWYVEKGRYDCARKEAYIAISFGLSPKLIAKWSIIWLAPFIAKRLFPKTKPYLS